VVSRSIHKPEDHRSCTCDQPNPYDRVGIGVPAAGVCAPTHGYAVTRDAAMAAFRKELATGS
jgi:hypothetical protein